MLQSVTVTKVFQEVEFAIPAIEEPDFNRLVTEIDGYTDVMYSEYDTLRITQLWTEFHQKYDRYFIKETD